MQHETSSSQLIKKRKEPQASEAGSFQLSQFGVNTHYLALRTTVKKIVVLTAFLSATVTANQAVACDMGAIETWVAVRSFLRQQLRPLLFRDDLSRYIRLFAWESAHPSKIFLKFMAIDILYDRCGRYRTQISVTRRRSADCATRSHLADGSMQRLRAKPGAACARAVQYYGRRAMCGRIDRAGYQVGLGRLPESQPNLIDSNTPDPMTAD